MTDDRTGYIAGLRQLATWLEGNPDLPLPVDGANTCMPIGWQPEDRSQMAALARAFPGPVKKDADEQMYRIDAAFAGLHVRAYAYRAKVCERVQTGTETITEHVPDPDMPPVPLVAVTREVPTYVWECPPLLAADVALSGVDVLVTP